MVHFSLLILALAATSVNGAPLTKRIAQVITEATAKWEKACTRAGGDIKCNPASIEAFDTLLVAAGPCAQQNAADKMIDLAKQLNNDADMITLTQIFVQQPRNSPDSLSIPYCQQPPKNAELNGLFQCQFKGVDPKKFVGGGELGSKGTIPFGSKAPLDPPGSCKANPDGPIDDGTQLVDLTKDPGVGNEGSGGGGDKAAKKDDGGEVKAAAAASASPTESSAAPEATGDAATPSCSATPADDSASTDSGSRGGSGGGDFKLQNGKDAQKLNAGFQNLNEGSPCQDGDQACISGGFAQCVGGKFTVTECSTGTICAALPLVNKPGTSIACTTQSDAEDRIKATGAKGSISGRDVSSCEGAPADTSDPVDPGSDSDSGDASGSSAPPANNNATSDTPPVDGADNGSDDDASGSPSDNSAASAGGGFKLQNGKDAQKLNASFQDLKEDSSCKDGDLACVSGDFAQCVGGKFAVTKCAGGTTCMALPLVNKPGTSITCTTVSQAKTRIEETGAKGGISG